jgi:hypothetical protein
MDVTRDVVTDLLPIYFSGEASTDTKRLVESYFRQDPDFERTARGAAKPLETLQAATPVAVGAEQEKRGLERVRGQLQRRAWLFAVSLFSTLVPLSFHFREGHVASVMVRDAPLEAAFFWSLAGFFWFLFFARPRRRTAALIGAIFFSLIPIPFVAHSIFVGEPVGALAIYVWTFAVVIWIGYFRSPRG